ncbi:MAG TPA: hypothetical protein VFL29_11105 [Candidatus Dormibacteraeota bacterium]|nr:hypothetical protein [Candidatus Dormibacteraeota bacterium]
MRFTWRDGAGTLITAGGVLAALAALQGWGWPLLADARAGVVTLLVMAFVVCPLGMGSPDPKSFYKDPFMLAAMVVGTAILVLGLIALFTTAAAYLPWMIALTIVSWLVTTAHHAVGPIGQARRAAA